MKTGRKRIDPTFADAMELSILHFAFSKTIMSLCRQYNKPEGFIGNALNMGMRNKTIMKTVDSIMVGGISKQSAGV